MEVTFFMWQEGWEDHEKNIQENVGEPTPDTIKKLLKYSVPFFTGGLCLVALIL